MRAMICTHPVGTALMITLAAFGNKVLAGQAQKWDALPKAVQETIVEHGGRAHQAVDKESGKKEGKAIYEATIKEKDGTIADLVILEDGKLIETKRDDEANTVRAKGKLAGTMKFSHPREINHPYLPLADLKQDVLEGKEGSKTVRIERTAKPEVRKTFKLGGQQIDAFAVEDREWQNGELAEVALDYFAQDDAGTVFYLGEDVDEYEGGKVVSHEGSWLLGKDTKKPGVILPARIAPGVKFRSEDVNKEIREDDEIVGLGEDVVTPAGTYKDCVKVKEQLADGSVEYKYYAGGVGVVREIPSSGDVRLASHSAAQTAKK